jgi:hypothetical protein
MRNETTKMSHSASFDIKTPSDFLERMVLPQYDDFLTNNASSRYALLCIVVAYHMYEWANNRQEFTKVDFEARYSAETHLVGSFELARRLVNGTKHFKNRIETKTQTGFSSAFSEEFRRPLSIVRDDGSETSADSLLREIVEFWKAEHAAGVF